ncbi:MULTISPECIES: hypothetical protein [Burkholderiaceae]|uniref:hypothetical protein n=1 Tax=Burkholderiaceae TaxID=119060 RepID=UPI0002A415FE|nr:MULTISPECIES: hypothetical protein [Burkholderiaceae]ELA00782.1 hypothetical protein D769_03190 [Cupriavidus sp. HMR-1]KVS16418.1 hypothetical protein WK32_27020 [Burkholderia vietnamiensis]MDR8057709.1 hypothetical protein [Burkholderia cenocepacia]MDR8062199.1 hypothetical protein [Burkholderia cenocepacia]
MVFDPMQLFLGGACVLTLVAFLCPVCLTVLASAVFSYMVGAGVGLSLAVGPGIVVRALTSDHTLGWPDNAGPIWCVGIPLGLAVFLTLMVLLFRDPGETSRAHA